MHQKALSKAVPPWLQILNFLVIIIFCFCSTILYSYETKAKSALVVDNKTGITIYEKNSTKPLPPASMSKLMTLNLIFEALEDNRISLDTKFRISADASSKGGSKMFINEGQLVSVEALIKGIAIVSGNDACIALAEGLSGTEDNFVRKMNLRAQELNLTRSYFTNSTGWPSQSHLMSANDLVTLAIRLQKKFPKYYKYFAEKEFTFNGIKQPNRNPLLKLDLGADGLKTGYTQEAGYGLVGSAKFLNRRITFVISGLSSAKERALEAERIANWAFRDFIIFNIFVKDQLVAEIDVWMGKKDKLKVKTQSEISTLISYGSKRLVKAVLITKTPIIAPILKGEEIGQIQVTIPSFNAGEKERTVFFPVVAAEDILKTNFLGRRISSSALLLRKLRNIMDFNTVLN